MNIRPRVGYAQLTDGTGLAYPVKVYVASCPTGDPLTLKDGLTSSGGIAIYQDSSTDPAGRLHATFNGVTFKTGCFNDSGVTVIVCYEKA